MRRIKLFLARDPVYFAWFVCWILWLEFVLKTSTVGNALVRGSALTVLFSLPLGLGLALFFRLFRGSAHRVVSIAVMSLITLYFWVQQVYFSIMDTFTTLYSAAVGGVDALEYIQVFFHHAGANWPVLLLFLLPLAAWCVLGGECGKKPALSLERGGKLFAAVLLAQVFAFCAALSSTSGNLSAKYLLTETFIPNLSVQNFGALTTLMQDVKTTVIGHSHDQEAAPFYGDAADGAAGEDQAEVQQTPQVLEIDFDALIARQTDETLADMHRYFASVSPTMTNEYSGKFAGKNLIWIVAEGFSTLALDEEKTPTLTKLSQEGFVFENFYNPIWYVSTSDGEYVTTTGLIPKSGVWSYEESADNWMPFAMGRQLSRRGYTCRAYHNHAYDYYARDVSHPNMGYTYKGLGNGLDITEQWPESDLEMMEATIPEYIHDEQFHTYYMTVSGHLEYNFSGNSMAIKHEDEVADLPYGEPARAYLACNMELDQAMAYLLDQLDKQGILDDTVIVLSGDHYPYGLELADMEELAGHSIDPEFELYRSTLIIWNAAMTQPVKVEKYCSSMDIMPTVANLMGVDYDSRLVMGRDILSDAPPLIIFKDYSFITDKGRYDAATDAFTPNPGVQVSDGYVAGVLDQVKARFRYSELILDQDYYRVVLPPEE